MIGPARRPWLAHWRGVPPHARLGLKLALAALAAAGALVALPLGQASQGFLDRSRERGRLAPLAAEAMRSGLSYDAIRADTASAVGKPVVWCVDHTGGVSYLSGRPSQPLVWSNEWLVPRNSPTTGGRCTTVLAVVEGARRDGVLLRYVGIP